MITCRTIYRRVTHHAAPAHHVAHPVRHAHHVRHVRHASVVCKYVGAGALALGLGTGGGALIGGSMPAVAWPAGAYGAPGYLPGGGAFDRVHRGRIVNPKGPQNVPEPASIAVFLVGAMAAFAVRRKK